MNDSMLTCNSVAIQDWWGSLLLKDLIAKLVVDPDTDIKGF